MALLKVCERMSKGVLLAFGDPDRSKTWLTIKEKGVEERCSRFILRVSRDLPCTASSPNPKPSREMAVCDSFWLFGWWNVDASSRCWRARLSRGSAWAYHDDPHGGVFLLREKVEHISFKMLENFQEIAVEAYIKNGWLTWQTHSSGPNAC